MRKPALPAFALTTLLGCADVPSYEKQNKNPKGDLEVRRSSPDQAQVDPGTEAIDYQKGTEAEAAAQAMRTLAETVIGQPSKKTTESGRTVYNRKIVLPREDLRPDVRREG